MFGESLPMALVSGQPSVGSRQRSQSFTTTFDASPRKSRLRGTRFALSREK
jgi:hypothetical protein